MNNPPEKYAIRLTMIDPYGNKKVFHVECFKNEIVPEEVFKIEIVKCVTTREPVKTLWTSECR